ncbi:beta-galactosidase [Alicyclobacillus sp. SO9]|uniref:beta-galactosidase n=1 Tax=Alicyclobacillus sp. SO9 TaxID=2665646 RepID=UPI0018E7AFD1|nr:beta-galactosidase [Alicyclobacillus sp. SO9]QQE77952.1 beta-galactosidase [Alicyclobacillus sp. SO9]
MINEKLPKIIYGGDYSPEQWPQETWDNDMELFADAGIDVATINVFSWAINQPDEDTYNFEWLDKVMDKLADRGMYACLATSTAAHPAWMAKRYPEVLSVDFDGRKRKFGMRHNSCPNSPVYRKYSRLMAQKLAERYRDHPALLLWHINNEYISDCYCDTCAAEFRKWLQRRYGSLQELNRAWYTAFWSHTFYDWDEIVPPNVQSEHWTPDKTAFPGISLDYARFHSESVLACYLEEYEAIKAVTPNVKVTTNYHGAGTYKPLDYFEWAKHMDIVAWDNYPSIDTPVSQIAFRHDLMRGMKDGAPYMIMEQTPSQQNWQPYNSLKRPGVMRLLSYQAVARGADGILFFQLKKSRGGCEKFHGAVIDHLPTTETRVFQECAALGQELKQLGDILLDSRVSARVAILFDWENWWAVEYSSGPTQQLKYVNEVQKFYDAFFSQHIPVDIISVDTDLTQYDIVIAPVLYMVKNGYERKLKAFVEAGGFLWATFFSGIVNESDLVTTSGYPGVLRDLLGVWVEELDALRPEDSNSLTLHPGNLGFERTYTCNMICEVVHPETAETVATYNKDFYRGGAAVTRNRYGSGEAWYVATNPEQKFIKDLALVLCEQKGILPLLDNKEEGIEVSRRYSDSHVFTFYLNHLDENATIDLGAAEVFELLQKKAVSGKQHVPPKGVLICQQPIR